MANAQLDLVLRHVRQLASADSLSELTDGELLKRFLSRHDESAFEELVRRLGPMVLGVCRRILANGHDAEDAFQAAFLMLACKGGSIRRHEAVAGWLYEVAHRMALKTKADAERRRTNERLAAVMSNAEQVADHSWTEMRSILEEELHHLPEKYRTPLVLCYLEGKTNEQAARELGWPAGSMSRQLTRARELLRERMTRRGLAVSAGLLCTLFVENAPAAVPPALLHATVKAATLFAAGNTAAAGVSAQVVAPVKEMLRTMYVAKLKIAAVLSLTVGILGLGTCFLVNQAGMPQAVAAPADPAPKAEKPAGTDLNGDPLPPGALARMGTTRFRHGSAVNFVGFAGDGKKVVTASQDGAIRLWELKTGKEIHRFEVKQPEQRGGPQANPGAPIRVNVYGPGMSGVALSSDGKTLAAMAGTTLQLWSVETGKELHQIKLPAFGTSGLTFLPDGKTLAARGNDRTLYFWSVETGKEVRQHKAKQPDNVRGGVFFIGGAGTGGLSFSPDGKTLATAEMEFANQKIEAYVKLTEVETGKEIRRIKGAQNNLGAVTFAPDGKSLVYASGKTIYQCETATGKEIRQFDGPQGSVMALVFAPGGKTLASKGFPDQLIRLWEVASGKEAGQLGTPAGGVGRGNAQVFVGGFGGVAGGRDFAFSPDGKVVLAAAGNTVCLWDVATSKELPLVGGHRGPVQNILIAPDGKSLLSRGADNTIRRWDSTGKELSRFPLPEGTTAVAFSPDGRTMALGNVDKTIRLHETATGKELRQLNGHVNGAAVLTFSPDSKTLASRGNDNSIKLHDVAKGSELQQITTQQANAQGNPGGVVMVWGGFGGSTGLAFSPDGKSLASTVSSGPGRAAVPNARGGLSSEIHVWDVTTGKVARKIALPAQRGVNGFVFSPDGRVLATDNTDQTITLWELASGKERLQLGKPAAGARPGATSVVVMPGGMIGGFGGAAASTGLAFAPDGSTLVARGPNKTVQVWDAVTGKEVGQFKGHDGDVVTVAFAPDGKSVASGSNDTTVLLWDVARLGRGPGLPKVELGAKEVETLWADLRGEDGGKAYQAILKLASAGKQSVPFLKEQLKPTVPVPQQKIDKWIADLESDDFNTRKTAGEQLEKLGELAVPSLKKVLAGQPALETRKRVEELLDTLTASSLSGDQVRLVRAVEVLDRLSTAEARQILETLAKGAPGALPTREAQAVLDRLAKRPASRP